jgi:hypothetical protein
MSINQDIRTGKIVDASNPFRVALPFYEFYFEGDTLYDRNNSLVEFSVRTDSVYLSIARNESTRYKFIRTAPKKSGLTKFLERTS